MAISPPCRASPNRRPATTVTSARTCSARLSWMSPAQPSGQTGPRGWCRRSSPCCWCAPRAGPPNLKQPDRAQRGGL